ncbi:MAG TPA: hypothetical protein VMI11_01580 [Actinomycetes bacterium]|nr:hypothetical protein [Actinomycetes bacterium]
MSSAAAVARGRDILRDRRLAVVALLVVSIGWLAASRLAVSPHLPLGYDEAVYLSQASTRPHLVWTAPRAYGLPLLVWPVAHYTASLGITRSYLSGLSSAFMFLAYLPWVRICRWTAVTAALLFASLWVSTFYSSQAMPNLFTALAGVGGVGSVAVALVRRRRSYLAAAVFAFGVMSLVRPSDAVYAIVPVLVALAAFRTPGRAARLRAGGAAILGLAIGWGFWTVEAFVNFGGPLHRLREASSQDGGLHFNLRFLAHTVSGPVAGRAVHAAAATRLWWWLMWPLALLGVWFARGAARRAYVLCAAAAAGVFVQYLFFIKVEAPGPRVLLPVYALLSVPVAQALISAVRRCRAGAVRTAAATAVVLLVLVNSLGQYSLVRVNARQQAAVRAAPYQVVDQLRAAGVREPCVLAGPNLPVIAYELGCHEVRGLPTPADVERARAHGYTLHAVLWDTPSVLRLGPRYEERLAGWQLVRLPRPSGHETLLFTDVPAGP